MARVSIVIIPPATIPANTIPVIGKAISSKSVKNGTDVLDIFASIVAVLGRSTIKFLYVRARRQYEAVNP